MHSSPHKCTPNYLPRDIKTCSLKTCTKTCTKISFLSKQPNSGNCLNVHQMVNRLTNPCYGILFSNKITEYQKYYAE